MDKFIEWLNLIKILGQKHIDMNTDSKKKQKMILKKVFLRWWIMLVLRKAMENVRKDRDIKLFTTERRRNYLVSDLNYQTTKVFSENLLAIEIKKKNIPLNKHAYLGLSILELSKILMYEFWYDYVWPRDSAKVKLCYMDTDSFIVYIKTWYL